MKKLPSLGSRGRRWSAARCFRGWLASWAQDRRRARSHSASASPVPLTVPGLKLWVRAESLIGLADGAAVASWSDESGNGKHLVQAVAGNRPIYKSTGEISPAVLFDGVNDALVSASNVFATNLHTIFLVARPLSAATNDAVGTGGASDGDVLLMVGYGDRMRGQTWRVGNANPPTDGATQIHNAAFAIFEQEVTATDLFLRLTGALDASRALVGGLVGASKPIYLGSRSNAWFFQGYVRALLVYEGNPSATDKDRIREFLISAYNIPVPYPPLPAPGAPTSFDAVDTGGGSAWLTWDISTSAYATGILIERKIAGQPDSNFVQVDEIGASEVDYYDGVGAGDYTYRIRAYNASGNSPFTDSVTVTIT